MRQPLWTLLWVLLGASVIAGQASPTPVVLATSEYEDVATCPVSLFRQANGSTDFAAGQYQVRYVGGCWRLGDQWTVGEPRPSEPYASWLLTDANGTSLVPASLGFSSAMTSVNETDCAAKAEEDLLGVLAFNHTGGEIGILLTACQTDAAVNRSNGAPNPTWLLEALQPEAMGPSSTALPALVLPSLQQCTSLAVGSDLWGNDLLDCPDSPLSDGVPCNTVCGFFNVTDAAACEQMCMQHPTCGAFTYKARGECWLKPASGFIRKPCEDCYTCVLPSAAARLAPAQPDVVGATQSMAPVCGTVQKGTDFLGGDLQTCPENDACFKKCQYTNITNMAACCDLCANKEGCSAYTFVSDGLNGPDSVGMCFLKGSGGFSPSSNPQAYSALMDTRAAQPSAPPSSPADASSVPIGAIVGGVCGGLAVLGVLAFLAFRPGKRWLRRPASGSAPVAAHYPPAGKGWQGAVKAAGSSWGAGDPELGSGGIKSSTDHLVDTHLPASRLSHWSVSTPDAPEGEAILGYLNSQLASLASNASSASRPSRGSGSAHGGGAQPAGVQQWEVQWGDLRVARLLGRGAFGRVYLAFWRKQPVATKVLISRDDLSLSALELPEATMRELQQEAATMASMRHPHIVQFLGLCTYPPCLVTELCSRGSLYDVLRSAAQQPELAAVLTWRLRLRMAAEAARGILYLHSLSPPILHRDIKSPNLLVDEEWHIKVSDFGLCKIMQEQAASSQTSTEGVTNPTWLAPEVLRGERATKASDVYSFGLVLLELLTWRLPWSGVAGFTIVHQVLKGSRPEVPPREELPGPDAAGFTGLDAYCQLMRECWAQEPAARPGFDDIVERLQALLEAESS